MHVSPERFEQIVFDEADAVLAQLPPALRAEAETVLLLVEDAPGPEHDPGERRLLLGLYEGVPLIDRHADSLLIVPDRITLFRLALQSLARTEIELRQRVRRTLIHELAHFFGRDEDELADRGWA
ncbi:MAG: metallopeptidase family protein [Anaerolineales bacterium]|nr:metallopeptidase family protein [Anaerolineales bacterium]